MGEKVKENQAKAERKAAEVKVVKPTTATPLTGKEDTTEKVIGVKLAMKGTRARKVGRKGTATKARKRAGKEAKAAKATKAITIRNRLQRVDAAAVARARKRGRERAISPSGMTMNLEHIGVAYGIPCSI